MKWPGHPQKGLQLRYWHVLTPGLPQQQLESTLGRMKKAKCFLHESVNSTVSTPWTSFVPSYGGPFLTSPCPNHRHNRSTEEVARRRRWCKPQSFSICRDDGTWWFKLQIVNWTWPPQSKKESLLALCLRSWDRPSLAVLQLLVMYGADINSPQTVFGLTLTPLQLAGK